ncbi:MAG: Ig-like domain-containing protein [Thermodesulfovibrionales bacterium]
MKKYIRHSMFPRISSMCFAVALLLSIASCSGGGAGSPTVSQGVGTPATNLSLFADKVVVGTGNPILLQAVLSDGNGKPLVGQPVAFSVVSGAATIASPQATTNTKGVATSVLSNVNLLPGIVVVTAQTAAAGASRVLYFLSSPDSYPALSLVPDANGDGRFGEPADYTVEADGHSSVLLKVTDYDMTGTLAPGRSIIFGSDFQGLTFDKSRAVTGSDGAAYASFTISAASVNNKTAITVYATDSTNGVSDLITVNATPITAGSINMTAGNVSITTALQTTVTACVLSTDGLAMPDGTLVRFGVSPQSGGSIDQILANTKVGCCSVNFTAGQTPGRVSVTANSQGVSGSIALTVSNPPRPLALTPATGNASINTSLTMMVTGGVAPYHALANTSTASVKGGNVTSDGGTFTVSDSAAESVGITVHDSVGNTATGSVVFTDNTSPLLISPGASSGTMGKNYLFAVTGGVPPYQIMAGSTTATINPLKVITNGGTFQVSDTAAEIVTITALDSRMTAATATMTFTDNTPLVGVLPQGASVAIGVPISFFITGGTAPFSVFLTSTTAVAVPATGIPSGGTFTVTDTAPESVIVTVEDAHSQTATSTLTVVGP